MATVPGAMLDADAGYSDERYYVTAAAPVAAAPTVAAPQGAATTFQGVLDRFRALAAAPARPLFATTPPATAAELADPLYYTTTAAQPPTPAPAGDRTGLVLGALALLAFVIAD